MKKLYPLILLTGMAGGMLAQIPNPSFETWLDGDPEGWTTSNVAAPSVFQVSDAHEGSSAVRIDAFTASGLTFGGTVVSDDFPVTSTSAALNGWYKANFVGGDYLNSLVVVNDATDQPVQTATASVTAAADVYTAFSILLQTVGNGTPTVGNISFLIYGPGGNIIGVSPGSSVTIDDLSWGDPVSVAENERVNTGLEAIIPNPAGGNPALVQFALASPGLVSIDLYDLTGKKVGRVFDRQMPAGRFRAEVEMDQYSPGVYFVRLTAGSSVFTMRLVN